MKLTIAALTLGTTLFATAALADSMSTTNTMAPTNAMAPAGGGMTMTHKPKPKTHKAPVTGGMMTPTNAMAPTNTMAPNTMGGSH